MLLKWCSGRLQPEGCPGGVKVGQVTGGPMDSGLVFCALSHTSVRRTWRNGTRRNGKGGGVGMQPGGKKKKKVWGGKLTGCRSRSGGWDRGSVIGTRPAEFLRVQDCGHRRQIACVQILPLLWGQALGKSFGLLRPQFFLL